MMKTFFLFAFASLLGSMAAAPLHAQTAKPAATATPMANIASDPITPNASPTPVPPLVTGTTSGVETIEKQTPRERQASPKALEKYDTNKNGVIDPEEKIAMKKDRLARHEDRLKKYDKNGDGKLDDAEKAVMRADEKAGKKANKGQ